MQELLQLPFHIQAVLVAGYMGYALYKRDHRKEEKNTDMLILMLVFGLPTAILLQLCDSPLMYLSIFTAPAMAYIWIKYCAKYWQDTLYKEGVSHNFNEGDVWKTLGTTKGVFATQITLYHKSGKLYMCADTSDFNGKFHAHFSPFIMDEDGIAFYVTDTMDKDSTEWIETDLTCENTGSVLTYFPRADIETLDMRYMPNKPAK